MFGAQGFSSAFRGRAKSPSRGPPWTLLFGARFPQGPPGAPRGLPEALQGPPESAPRRPGSPQRLPKFGQAACVKPGKYVCLAPKDLQQVTFCDFGRPPGTSFWVRRFPRAPPGAPRGPPEALRGPPGSAPGRPGSTRRPPGFGRVTRTKPCKYVRRALRRLQKAAFRDFGGSPGASFLARRFPRTPPGAPRGPPEAPRGPRGRPEPPRDPPGALQGSPGDSQGLPRDASGSPKVHFDPFWLPF